MIYTASCCLNKTDRELLNKARIDAKETKLLAEEAIKDADEAVQKSERIFKRSQKK